MSKLLTVAVPSYNAEAYLEKCMDSMLLYPDSRLEVIIVNDGSTDGTASMADGYASRHPDIVRVIHKQNGGHGSCINTAAKAAEGKYFKVIDADDWIVPENLKPMLDALDKHKADAVIAAFQTINMKNGSVNDYTLGESRARLIDVPELIRLYGRLHPCCSIHGLAYLTETYRRSGVTISEGIFYDDNEYATLPFSHVKSILLLPLMFYQYRIGNANQSVASKNMVSRVEQLVKAAHVMAEYSDRVSDEAVREYITRKTSTVVNSVYATLLVRNPNKKEGRMRAELFRAEIVKKLPEAAERMDKRYRLLRRMNYLRVPPGIYESFSNTGLYRSFRQLWGR